MKPNGPVFTLRVAIVKLLFCVMVRVITAVSVRLRVRVINTKNLKSFIIVKAHCSMTHLKQQKSLGFF